MSRALLYTFFTYSHWHWCSTHFCFVIGTYLLVLCDYGWYIHKLFTAIGVTDCDLVQEHRVSPKRYERWARRHRRRKPPFHLRRKIAMKKMGTRRITSVDVDDDWNLHDFIDRPSYWRWLHLAGDNFGEEFDRQCDTNPQFLDLFGTEWKFQFNFSQMKNTKVESFGLHLGNDVIVDMTKLSDSGNVFRFQSVYHAEQMQGPPVIFDSGASISITPDRSDFTTFTSNTGSTTLTGITSTAVCKGKGTILLTVLDDDGNKREIKTEALYVPAAKVKLLSVQRYCSIVKEGARFLIDEDGCVFRFPNSQGGGTITFDLESDKNLPQTSVIKQWSRKMMQEKHSGSKLSSRTFTVVAAENLNLDNAQKQLLEWHYKLGHYNMNWIRALIRHQIIQIRGHNASIGKCYCQACQLSKQTRKPDGAVNKKIRPEKDGALKKNIVAVGGRVSTDQFVSSLPGRLGHTFGKEKADQKYTGGTIFIDEASEFIFVQNQVSLGAPETVRAKTRFEREALRHGIVIRGYRGDNGVYKSALFKKSCEDLHQSLEFCGVGAHHHNGVAERGIRTVSTCARTMLLHAMLHWPEQTTLDLWPFAVDYAVFLWNRMPRERSKVSPLEIFYSTKSDHEDIRNARVWGCPTYVLDPTLQDGKKLPRWRPRSKLGQFLGRSKTHASSVGLIKNIETGGVSSQFHVVYDDHFSTRQVNSIPEAPDLPREWIELFKYEREKYYDDDDVRENTLPPVPQFRDSPAPPVVPNDPMLLPPAHAPTSPPPSPVSPPSQESGERLGHSVGPPSTPTPAPQIPSNVSTGAPTPPVRRSRRLAGLDATHTGLVMDDNYLSFLDDFHEISHHDLFLVQSDLNEHGDSLTRQYDILHLMVQDDYDDSIQHGTHPLAFSARANAEDTPTLEEAMNSPDREGFIAAMHLELEQLESLDAWIIVPRDRAVATGRKILASTWAFKRKRYPDGSVKKLKARLVARGDQQIEGVDYFDSFSPVVQWSTIRLLLILSIMLDLETVQVDYTLAFVQAPAENDTFVEMPRMFEMPGYVFELKKNLYGLCEAPRNFFQYLKKGLNDRGLQNSRFDHCLFFNDKVMVMCYVDDCIFLAREKEDIDELINNLRKPTRKGHDPFILSKEEDYAGFLGIDIRPSKTVEGAIELLQVGLIDRVLKVLSLDEDNAKMRYEPAAATPLGKEEDGNSRKEQWSYASVIGMMLYLASNSRPDIAFAVNQCARFTHCANNQHEIALKRIGRYLKATRENGLIMKPKDELQLELYADADFAGLWAVEQHDDPISVKSRTGYVIMLGDVPVTWHSKLQTEIATSTMHAEYIALSTGMRELLPVKNILEEVCEVLDVDRDESVKVIKVFEDNEGALKLATGPLGKITPQSKHFAVKYHWFREKLDENKIDISHVTTDLQKADIFTKGLIGPEFRAKRKMLTGW